MNKTYVIHTQQGRRVIRARTVRQALRQIGAASLPVALIRRR